NRTEIEQHRRLMRRECRQKLAQRFGGKDRVSDRRRQGRRFGFASARGDAVEKTHERTVLKVREVQKGSHGSRDSDGSKENPANTWALMRPLGPIVSTCSRS